MDGKHVNLVVETLDEDPRENQNSTFYNSENISLNTSGLSENILKADADIEKREDLLNEDKLFGVNIKIERPKKIGKVFALFYYESTPLLIIGPDCNLYIKNI
jgi:hypothetical protein